MEPEWTFIAEQRLGKHILTATNTQETMDELPFLCNGEVNTSPCVEAGSNASTVTL
jgi:hypothetical protein